MLSMMAVRQAQKHVVEGKEVSIFFAVTHANIDSGKAVKAAAIVHCTHHPAEHFQHDPRSSDPKRPFMCKSLLTNTQGETVDVPERSGLLITGCKACTINVPGKSTKVTLERCSDMVVRAGSVVASLEVIGCTSVEVSVLRCACQQPYSCCMCADSTDSQWRAHLLLIVSNQPCVKRVRSNDG